MLLSPVPMHCSCKGNSAFSSGAKICTGGLATYEHTTRGMQMFAKDTTKGAKDSFVIHPVSSFPPFRNQGWSNDKDLSFVTNSKARSMTVNTSIWTMVAFFVCRSLVPCLKWLTGLGYVRVELVIVIHRPWMNCEAEHQSCCKHISGMPRDSWPFSLYRTSSEPNLIFGVIRPVMLKVYYCLIMTIQQSGWWICQLGT
jgi:hypothetical protein